MKIGEFFVSLGFQSDNAKLKDFIHGLGELNLNSVIAASGMATLYEALRKVTEAGLEMAKPINAFNKEMGGGSQYMQRFEKFSQRMGVSAGVATNTLKRLQGVITGFKYNMGDQSFLKPLNFLNAAGAGIDIANETKESLNEKIFKGLKNISPELRTQLMSWMGISDEMLQAYITEQAMWETQKDISTLDDKQVGDLMRYNEALVAFGQDWQMILARLAVIFEPILRGAIQFLDTIIKVGGELESLKVIVDALGIAWALMWRINPLIRFVTLLLLIPKILEDAISLFKKMGDAIPDFMKGPSNLINKLGNNPMVKGIANFNNDVIGRLEKFLSPMLNPDHVPVAPGAKTQTNSFTFHVSTNNPESFAQRFKELAEKQILNADRQNPIFGI